MTQPWNGKDKIVQEYDIPQPYRYTVNAGEVVSDGGLLIRIAIYDPETRHTFRYAQTSDWLDPEFKEGYVQAYINDLLQTIKEAKYKQKEAIALAKERYEQLTCKCLEVW